ncbi:MAG: carboxypeptidase-like regulatory domain-containing protein [Acidobacteriota bacterium]
MNKRMILALLAVSGLLACLSFAQEAIQLDGAALGNCQTGWRWCSKCDGLSYIVGGVGPCPGGGTHATGASDSYVVVLNDPKASGVHGFHQCSRCKGLFHPTSDNGVCPAGGTHDATGSGDYCLIPSMDAEIGQEGWGFCSKCQGVFYGAYAPHGICPAGGQHALYWGITGELISESKLPILWGKVTKSSSQAMAKGSVEPVSGAKVEATKGGTTITTKTKADGSYCFTGIALGKHSIKASKRKVGTASGTVRIKNGDTKSVDLSLEK